MGRTGELSEDALVFFRVFFIKFTKLRSLDYIWLKKLHSSYTFNRIECLKRPQILDLTGIERYPSKCCKSRKNVSSVALDERVEKLVTSCRKSIISRRMKRGLMG
jgi:hypothetical protein